MTTKRKKTTVNALIKKLQSIVDQGYGHVYVCIDRDTFDELDDETVDLMHVGSVNLTEVDIVRADGGSQTRGDGSALTRMTAVIGGTIHPWWRE